MSKLTLSVNDQVIRRAKRYAAKRGTSVSQLVEGYLDLVSEPSRKDAQTDPPVLQRLRGAAKGASLEDYRGHLIRKYR